MQVQSDKNKKTFERQTNHFNTRACNAVSGQVCLSARSLTVTDSLRATVFRQEEEQEAGPVTNWRAVQQPVASAAVR